jgi:nucleotide-binding universal stress UspA family protein
MLTVKTILCPVDFFRASDNAVKYAVALASNYGARIHLLHVVPPVLYSANDYAVSMGEWRDAIEKDAAGKIKSLAAKLKAQNIPVESEVCVGDVHDEIKRSIQAVKPDLIVMGTHGRRAFERWFMGSKTERLLRHTPVPLLTVTANEKLSGTPRFRQILVTTDFSEGTEEALAYAFSMAQENESRVTLLHVVHDIAADLSGKYRDALARGVEKGLEDLVPPEARNWCDIVTRVETGLPYRIILRILEDEKIDLLVMNIHGKGMLDRAMIGSTAERVVRGARCPVMMIPPLLKAGRKVGAGERAAS